MEEDANDERKNDEPRRKKTTPNHMATANPFSGSKAQESNLNLKF